MTSIHTLHDVETTLLLLFEIDPNELPEELRAEYEIDLLNAIREAPEKRERVAIKLFDFGQRAAVKRAAATEHRKKADDLEASAKRYEADADRLKDYVLRVMQELPRPKRGPRFLEGTSSTLKAMSVADSVEVYDKDALPDEFRMATVTMPMAMYRTLLEAQQVPHDAPTQEMLQAAIGELSKLPAKWDRVEKSIIKTALQNGPIPGARLLTDKLRLVVE